MSVFVSSALPFASLSGRATILPDEGRLTRRVPPWVNSRSLAPSWLSAKTVAEKPAGTVRFVSFVASFGVLVLVDVGIWGRDSGRLPFD